MKTLEKKSTQKHDDKKHKNVRSSGSKPILSPETLKSRQQQVRPKSKITSGEDTGQQKKGAPRDGAVRQKTGEKKAAETKPAKGQAKTTVRKPGMRPQKTEKPTQALKNYVASQPWKKKQFWPVPAVLLAAIIISFTLPIVWANSTIARQDGFVALAEDIVNDEEFQHNVAAEGASFFMQQSGSMLERIPNDRGRFRERIEEQICAAAERALTEAVKDQKFKGAWASTLETTHQGIFNKTEKPKEQKTQGATLELGAVDAYLNDRIADELRKNESVAETINMYGAPAPRYADSLVVNSVKTMSMLENAKNVGVGASVLLVLAVAMMIIAVIIAKKRYVVAALVGGSLIVVSLIWYISDQLGKGIMAEKYASDKLSELFVTAIDSSLNAGLGVWVAATVIVGAALCTAGVLFNPTIKQKTQKVFAKK